LFFSPPKLENIGEILISTRYKTRSPFSALGGVGDHFRSPVDLCKNCRTCPALVCRMCLLLEIAVFNNFNIYFKEHITAFCEYVYVYIYVCIIHMIKYDNMYAHILIYILIMTMIKTEIITILMIVISSSSYIYIYLQ
jgi:hypothetical protein